MLKHFRDLLRANHRMILGCALGAGLIALTLSVLLLAAKPLYEATVAVTMEPSEEELRFNRAFMGVSQFNPATIIAQSHVERLLSRPVAERAIDMLTAEMGGAIPSKGPSLFSELSTAVWAVWNTLNYGYSAPIAPREQVIADLQNAISVEIVEGSYILNIGITYDDAEIAAAAANVLARAYVAEAQDGFRRESEDLAATIGAAEAEVQARLVTAREARQALLVQLGVTDPVAERAILLQARQDARNALRATEADIASQESRLAALRQSLSVQPDVAISRGIRETLATGQADLQQLGELRRQRAQDLAATEAGLGALDVAQTRVSGSDEQIAALLTDLTQLQERRAALELSTRARLSQVMIINPATVPLYPKFPKVAVNTIIATIAGALLALVPVFARDALGSQVRTAFDIAQVGNGRALPSLSRGRIARGRRLGTAEVDRLVRQIAMDRGGWDDRALMITGVLPEAGIRDLAKLFDGARGSDGKPISALAMPPLTTMADWAALHGQVVIFALGSGEVARSELAAMQGSTTGLRIHPYYLVVL